MKRLICALMLMILLLTLCACGFNGGVSYPNADKYAIGSFTYDAVHVKAVEINWTAGIVELRESQEARLSVNETTDGLTQDQQMRWWLDGSTLRIQYWKSGYTGTLNNKVKRIEVEIPKDISLTVKVTSGELKAGNHQLKDVKITATSGDIQLGAINADDMEIQATSGTIQTGAVRVQKQFKAGCTSGTIKLENAMAEKITLDMTSGSITSGPIDASASLTANCTSGKLKLNAVKTPSAALNTTSGDIDLGVYQCGEVKISTTSGDVTLTAIHGSGMTVDFKTNSGSLNKKKEKDQKNYHEIIGNGESKVTVSTASGDLKVFEE